MKSPFPGMDPFLEQYWHDIHANLVALTRTALNESLPEDLVARSEDRVAIDAGGEPGLQHYQPDVTVTQPAYTGVEASGTIHLDAPLQIVIEPRTEIQHYVRIVNARDESLITVIEFLSPSNKIGRGMVEYRQKRDELLAQGVHVVEIDLVRSGNWRALLQPGKLKIATPYRVITRPWNTTTAYVYPLFYDQPLPKIQIPLRPEDPEVRLELQPLLDAAYRGGRYSQFLHYDRPLDPPASPEEAEVIRQILGAAGRA